MLCTWDWTTVLHYAHVPRILTHVPPLHFLMMAILSGMLIMKTFFFLKLKMDLFYQRDVFCKLIGEISEKNICSYYYFFFNFPSSWIQMPQGAGKLISVNNPILALFWVSFQYSHFCRSYGVAKYHNVHYTIFMMNEWK